MTNVENNNNENKKLINESSGTGVLGSLIIGAIMLIFMIVLSQFMQ